MSSSLFLRATLTGVLVGGGGAAWLTVRSNNSSAEKIKELSATEFNSLQNQKIIASALKRSHLPWTYHNQKSDNKAFDPFTVSSQSKADDYRLTFYRLLGCPYCAKVQAVLQYHDVPYEEVLVDPINGAGLPDKRYQLAPQIQFAPLRDGRADSSGESASNTKDADSAFIVDSTSIVTALSEPLRFGRDLRDKRIHTTREWISNHFQGASFAIANHSLRSAYEAYGYLTPEHYQRLYYRIPGSIALHALARYKIAPKIRREPHSLTLEYKEKNSKEASGEQQSGNGGADVHAWMREEVAVFLDRRSGSSVFHGGSAPDLADVEMYGVTRVLSEHPSLGRVLRDDGAFEEWETAMQQTINKRREH